MVSHNDIICLVKKGLKNDSFIQIETENIQKRYTVDLNECDEGHALLMCLSDFLENNPQYRKRDELHLYVNHITSYNILSSYLKKWKDNNWIMARGKPCSYVDILHNLYDCLKDCNYTTHFIQKKC